MSVDESHSDTVAAAEPEASPPHAAQPEPAAVKPKGRSVRLGRQSLTARLVIGVVALVTVLIGAIGSLTYFALRSSLYDRLDQQVSGAAARNASYFARCVRVPAGLECPRLVGPSQSPHEWVALLYANGTTAVEFKAGPLSQLDLTASQQVKLARNPGQAITVQNGPNELRVSAEPNDEGLVVVTGLSTQDVHETLTRLVTLEVLIGGAGVLIAFLTTSLGVRRSLRNLYKVTGTAREVAAELSPTGTGLERRVPVTEEGTEVGQLAESFNTMLAAVETQFAARVESEQRMRQFLADASHELRTPLTSIRGYAELARMQRAAGSTEQDNLDRIESEGTRMSRLVDDLLMLARGDADDSVQHLERAPVDIAEILDDAVAGSRAAFPDRTISIDTQPLPAVLGDRDQLLRVVRNLVTNAAVHTEPGRPIEVRGRADSDGVVISVIDSGPGLPPEQAAHVFERFWRADKARTRARGGSGLGLSIVAAVVRAHGGTVRFDSDVERGSTITVRLPVVR
jgi:two-component system OmpR family sensor kinase